MEMVLPAAVSPGDTATLLCRYDLEGEPLYTIKFYKGREEFYRYMPKEHPQTQIFPLPGIDVDVSKSGRGKVVLREIGTDLAGKYRCEVSADAPNFDTEVVSGLMQVVRKLESAPELMVEKPRYAVGDTLRANCTSPAHTPLPNLTVIINGRTINASFQSQTIEENGTMKLTVGISYLVTTGGRLKIQCIADLYNAFKTKTEVILEEDRPRLASVRGTRDSDSGGGSMTQHSTLQNVLTLIISSMVILYR